MLDTAPVAQLVACRTCLAVVQIQPHLPLDGETCGDYQTFFAVHRDHRIDLLLRLDERSLSDRPLWDPMATKYFEVTNGQERLLVRCSRPSIEDPVERTLVPGTLAQTEIALELEPDLIRRALDEHFYPNALRPTKVQQLLAELDELVHHIDPDTLGILYDDADDAQVSIARLPEQAYEDLAARCRRIFDDWEFERVQTFLTGHSGEDGVLTVRMKRVLSIQSA